MAITNFPPKYGTPECCPDCGFYLPMCDCNTEYGRQRKIMKSLVSLQEQADLFIKTVEEMNCLLKLLENKNGK